MQPELLSTEYRAARRAYEWGRLRWSLLRAMAVVFVVAIVVYTFSGVTALSWLPVTLGAWVFAYWRGGSILRGALSGLVAGAVTYALPMTILRPCCSPEKMMNAGMDCCTMPSACLGAGALVGLVLASFVPLGPSPWRVAFGMALGVASIAILRCSTLFFGESLGLLVGLLAGIVALSLARGVHGRASTR